MVKEGISRYKKHNQINQGRGIPTKKYPTFFEKQKNHPKRKNSKTSRNMPKISDTPFDQVSNPSGSVVSGWTKNTQKPDLKNKNKKHPNRKNSKTSRDMPKLANLRPLLTVPQGFRISKSFGHRLWNRHTHTHTDKSTYRKHRPRGPEGRCFENTKSNTSLLLLGQ